MAQYRQIINIQLSRLQEENNRLKQENDKLKQALEMIMTQSRLEFDKTATIIGYLQQKQI